MPRIRRLIPIKAAMHVMCRGNNKQDIFNVDRDKSYYYSLLRELKKEDKITIFHYCLMNNHLHLVVWLEAESRLSRFMKQVNLTYFNYYNKKYGYSGHLWQDRFKSNIVDTDSYLLQCGKYIELNPVRAGLVGLPEEYRFSSYNHYTKGKYDVIITDSPVYLGLSDSTGARRKQYSEFVVNDELMNTKRLAKQAFIGSQAFIAKLEEYYGLRNQKFNIGRPRK